MAQGKGFSRRRLQVEQGKRKSILDPQAFKKTFGLGAEITVFFGQKKNVHLLLLSLDSCFEIRKEIGDRHIHGIVG